MDISTEPSVLVSPRRPHCTPIWHGLIIVLVAALLCLPCLIHGVPVTGGSWVAATYQHQFSRQFWNGEFDPRWLMVIALSTLVLGVFAYCHASEDDARRDRTLMVLLVTACVAFLLMLPWSAFVWKAIPDLAAAIQFPWRFGAFLSIAAAGLFAAAIDRSLYHRANRGGSRWAMLVTFMAIAVIGAGVLTWRADRIWTGVLRNADMVVHVDENWNVDQNVSYLCFPRTSGGICEAYWIRS